VLDSYLNKLSKIQTVFAIGAQL